VSYELRNPGSTAATAMVRRERIEGMADLSGGLVLLIWRANQRGSALLKGLGCCVATVG
jgi:hypothetical protein